jgi:uncharacterized membrane protein
MPTPKTIKPEKIDRMAIWLTDAFGSLFFLIMAFFTILIYILWNLNYLPGLHPFDRYPFSGLDMVLSIFAIFLSISVLMSQNRQRRLEKIREQLEFEVNVRAEQEITKVLDMLHRIQRKLGIDEYDPELEKMKQDTDVARLHEKISKEENEQ